MGTCTRLAAVAFLIVACSGSLSASAGDYTPYHQLRQLHPQVGEAVGAMPSSNVHGSLNCISSLLTGSDVAVLPPGSTTLLPPRFERQMVKAVEGLGQRLLDVDRIPLEDRYTILQVVSVQVFERNRDLYSDADWEWCDPASVGCENPPVLQALDALAQQLLPHLIEILLEYEELAAGDPSYPAMPPIYPDSEYNSQTFEERIEELQDSWGYAHGEPIIDS